jgi:Acetyltransferase (GNAT) domain
MQMLFHLLGKSSKRSNADSKRPYAGRTLNVNATPSLERYNQLLRPARERFEASPGLNTIRSNNDPRLLEAFLLYFSAIGAQMTEPVESWIRRAASRCAALGFADLAAALDRHAKAEAGHHLMMIADLRSLAAHWNTRHRPPVDADELLRTVPSYGASRYCMVHEENIAGDTPYAQIAIEYEIEQLPLRYGGFFVARCLEIFGPEILSSISFVTEHIDLDIGHTHFNAQQLSKLIDLHPESLPSLVAAGGAALDAYAQFLTDCFELAENHCRFSRARSERPCEFLSWQLHRPLLDSISGAGESWPEWINEVRSLRGAALFGNGRRPHFRTNEGLYSDSDPIDLHAWHLLAYAGDSLAGCVRIYPLAIEGPPCLTELLLGEAQFSRMLCDMGRHRDNAIEIGRWVVDPALRISGSLAPGIAVQLAAGAGALAFALVNQSEDENGVAIFSAGSREKQYQVLSRLGLRPVSGIDPVTSTEYDDVIRVMYCTNAQELQSRFRRMMDAMAETIRLGQMIPASAIHFN